MLETPSCTTDPQTGNRKKRAESVWWKKGTARKQRRERSRLREWLHAALVTWWMGGAEEPNNIRRGQGIC